MKKFSDILIALEKIAKKTGEDEDDSICDLKNQFNIRIAEEASSLRESLGGKHIWIWILKPYNKKDLYTERYNLRFIKFQLSSSIYKIVRKEKVEGKYYIKYPKYILLSDVQDAIFERLYEEHGIKNKDFTEIEWEDILCSMEFKYAEIQMARELIAQEYHHKILSKIWRF
ncbi:MAG: hypothetical protein ACFFCV_11545 [Promethearchaeota archaeon]